MNPPETPTSVLAPSLTMSAIHFPAVPLGAGRRTGHLSRQGPGAVLFLLVGLPGSGKTTRAREIERTHRALRFSPDEWMIPLFGDADAGGKRDILEGRLIWVALRAIQAGISAVLDVGFWARDERSALIWLAESLGAHAAVMYLPIDEPTQVERITARLRTAPDTTFALSAEDLADWRALFQVPTDDELAGTFDPQPPAGYDTWSDWASARWPSLPPLDDLRLGQSPL